MALWSAVPGKVYLPPSAPVARVLRTDEYVKETDVYFYASTERLLIVGNPYFDVESGGNITVPKVSANQYRVFRCKLPDPNKFALVDKTIFNSDNERLVWKLTGLEVGRGGPLGVGSTGHPLFNKLGDTENPGFYLGEQPADERQNLSIDPKQSQILIVGCAPATGEYWDLAKPCNDLDNGAAPPIQLVNTLIQDGDMGDIGFGAANFAKLMQDRAGVPLELIDSISIWPDFLKMTKDIYGNEVFFFGKREQCYARHLFARAGTMGEPVPNETNGVNYINAKPGDPNPRSAHMGSSVYFATPSGSLNTSDSQIFNRPYWLRRAQGTNNGICWGNELFITVFDNTRNVNFTISVKNDKTALTENPIESSYQFSSSDFKQYQRHTEEYEIELVFQLCKVSLTADVLAHLHVMNPRILDEWQLAFVPPAPSGIEDIYRYIKSKATKCPEPEAEEETDPYKAYTFWNLDLSERFSSDLSQFSLGRKFLYQTGLLNGKRARIDYTSAGSSSRSSKRKRTK